jgi:hypothetical protein
MQAIDWVYKEGRTHINRNLKYLPLGLGKAWGSYIQFLGHVGHGMDTAFLSHTAVFAAKSASGKLSLLPADSAGNAMSVFKQTCGGNYVDRVQHWRIAFLECITFEVCMQLHLQPSGMMLQDKYGDPAPWDWDAVCACAAVDIDGLSASARLWATTSCTSQIATKLGGWLGYVSDLYNTSRQGQLRNKPVLGKKLKGDLTVVHLVNGRHKSSAETSGNALQMLSKWSASVARSAMQAQEPCVSIAAAVQTSPLPLQQVLPADVHAGISTLAAQPETSVEWGGAAKVPVPLSPAAHHTSTATLNGPRLLNGPSLLLNSASDCQSAEAPAEHAAAPAIPSSHLRQLAPSQGCEANEMRTS